MIGDAKGQVHRARAGPRTSSARRTHKGRRRPEPVKGSEFVIPCDMVLVAIGQKQDISFLGDLLPNRTAAAFRSSTRTCATELPNVWAAGDYVVNPTNFISSIGEGKRVADLIDQRAARHRRKVKEMEITRVPTEYRLDPESRWWRKASPSGA